MKTALPVSIRMKLLAMRIAKLLLLLIITMLVAHSVALVVLGRQLEDKLAEIRRQGLPVSMSDVVPAPVPDNQNAAALYKKIFSNAALKDITVGDPRGDLIDDFLKPSTTPTKRAKLEMQMREKLAECKPLFPVVKQAVSYPGCIFPIKWEDGLNAALPHLGPLTKLAKITAAKAVIDSRDGDMEAVVDDVILGLGVADSLDSEPCLVSYLVRRRNTCAVLDGLMEATRGRQLSTAQAERLYRTLDGIDLQSGLEKGMRGELASYSCVFDTARTDVVAFYEQYAYSFTHGTGPIKCSNSLPEEGKHFILSFLWRPLSYKEQAFILNQWEKLAPAQRLPYREARNILSSDGAAAWPRYYIITQALWPAYSRIFRIRDVGIAQVGLAQTSVALKAYKSKFRSYPATLNELKQKFGWALPDDPFSGKPFIYTRQGQGFKLYSIGGNLMDDGGKRVYNSSGFIDPDKGDVVWESEV